MMTRVKFWERVGLRGDRFGIWGITISILLLMSGWEIEYPAPIAYLTQEEERIGREKEL